DNADLDEALFLLSLPKELGEHPDGGRVIVGLGRFGPYVAHDVAGKLEYRSIPPAQLTTIALDDALALLAAPKRGRGQAPATALRELGPHPADGKPIRLLDGRFGPYLKHGDTNATLPKGTSPEAVTIEQAVDLLAERAAKGPTKKRPTRRAPKKATKKT
ncbi:MAG: topoisomerase, partial [Thermoplasmata archaeon]|nr:topoisomerase [Thermoplasmata archaeon]